MKCWVVMPSETAESSGTQVCNSPLSCSRGSAQDIGRDLDGITESPFCSQDSVIRPGLSCLGKTQIVNTWH